MVFRLKVKTKETQISPSGTLKHQRSEEQSCTLFKFLILENTEWVSVLTDLITLNRGVTILKLENSRF